MPVCGVVRGFLVQHTDGLSVQELGLLVVVSDAHNTEFSELGKSAHEMKHHASLGGGVKMKTMVDRDVDEIVGREATVGV